MSSTETDTDYELHERIETVAEATAERDELVTLSVPADDSLGNARERVETEHASADYIDSDEASTHLTDALERVRRTLHEYEELPDNGLVVYAGVLDGDLTDFVFDDLPSPVEDEVFVQSNEFDTDPLDVAADDAPTYGLLVVERGGAVLGWLEDDRIDLEETYDSDVMGKTRAGGQSEGRFERERERQAEEFYDTVADAAARTFLDDPSATASSAEAEELGEQKRSANGESDDDGNGDGDGNSDRSHRDDDSRIDGLLVGGTTVTAEQFLEEADLDHRLEERLVGPFSVEYASEQGLRQLVENAEDHLEDAQHARAREALERFFTELQADGEGETEATYGREEVDRALEFDAVETLLVAETLDVEEIRELEERVTDAGGECLVVSTGFEAGQRLEQAFGGVAALLRFPVE
ncbi:Vms1/Ankzf1 family peptidyl-tRNA hydrolase [Natronoglomus mannanivorans]|uniref:Vms1/Ankzf1 family peptidyl-tRNA hydrolase n=1 Tax=Natronoglomus mannanivorans TaxID=2979990 RepID=A0AAP3E3D4_9EURY|nr:Vms1/Ankzf1 family peptidyl-tRNA hydrolase [Halobacteria archaeon AArc-xg1-1]